MRISVYSPASCVDRNTDEPVESPAVLKSLDGWKYTADHLANYLDMGLADLGVIGGEIRAAMTDEAVLEVVADFWAPFQLGNEQLRALREEVLGQWSDGLGENGFEVDSGGRELLLVPDSAEARIEQVEDGRAVPPVSRVAQAARNGDLDSLQASLVLGDAIDSTLQGYSGLHLAILYGQVEAAVLLIERGANPNLLDKDGNSPLHLCALSNSLTDKDSATIAMQLVRRGGNPKLTTPTGDTALSYAEVRGRSLLLETLNATQ